MPRFFKGYILFYTQTALFLGGSIACLSGYRIITIKISLMGISKTDDFTLRDNRIAKYGKALSHPARIAILQLLIKKQSCVCGAIVKELPLSQSTVSQHLKELKDAGLIKGEIDGAKVCYCINDKEWDNAKLALRSLFTAHTKPRAK